MTAIPNDIAAIFSEHEIDALTQFYAGTPARTIRKTLQLNPWDVLQRHRHLEQALYERVMQFVSAQGHSSGSPRS
jgi:hypothetical protein